METWFRETRCLDARAALAITVLTLGMTGPAWGQGQQGQAILPKAQAQSPAPAPAETDDGPIVEPEALALLKAAGDWLASQESYAIRSEIEYDEVYGEATHVRVGGRASLLVRRPNHFKVFFEGDRGQKNFLYDGKTFVLSDLRSKTWASAPVSGTNDEAVDTIVGKMGIVIPLSDFLLSKGVYGADEIQAAYVIGQSMAAGKRCHQVLVILDDIDFQVWIEADGNPVFRKLVISYREATGQPQFEATFNDWVPGVTLSDYTFSFLPDRSFRKVELAAPVADEVKK